MQLLDKIVAFVCLLAPAIAFGQDAGGSVQPSTGDNTACWSYSANQEVSPQITCTPLTTDLLTHLRFATKKQIQAVMREPGEVFEDRAMRYISNYDRGNSSGSGSVDFTFNNAGKVIIIDAEIDVVSQSGNTANAEYLWNADRKFFCSDIPVGAPACN